VLEGINSVEGCEAIMYQASHAHQSLLQLVAADERRSAAAPPPPIPTAPADVNNKRAASHACTRHDIIPADAVTRRFAAMLRFR
jgi:Iap family predicted aminopeptidase